MTDNEVTILPGGSAFSTMECALPKDHWIYQPTGSPPMPLRMGEGEARHGVVEMIWAAAKYAIRGATMSGKDDGFDPDALCQNMVVGLIGYHTADGTVEEGWANPKPVPPLWKGPKA